MKVVVIGGGVIGLLAAHHLRKQGAQVTVLERDRPGGACSAGNAGWITPSISIPLPAPGLRFKSLRWMLRSDSPLYIKPTAAPAMLGFLLRFWKYCNERDFTVGTAAFASLGADTMELYDELEAEGISFESHHDGLLMAFRDEAELRAERRLIESLDYGPLRAITADELRQLEPALAPGVVGGLHVMPERTVRPEQVCAAVTAHLNARGVAVESGRQVDSLASEGRQARAVLVDGEAIEADAFLIATGAESARLAAQCGCLLPLQAGKGYSITVSRPEVEVKHPLYLGEAKAGITPFADGVRIAGTMELSGINLDLDPRRIRALERAAELEVPGVTQGAERVEWVGMRPLTPDGLPMLGRLPTRDNVFVATGHQMLGVTLAPSSGKAMATLMLEGRSDRDLSAFDPARFS